ncbi:DNA polymerase ligase-domain-containing protein [Aspergillus pseudoustus]|uniref:DNA polymerase ligase-domain-containing protein n=1 Tax=Aspergillus pseudoustus TaxID=1810923 RepID=A0ABR4KY35_9EURO
MRTMDEQHEQAQQHEKPRLSSLTKSISPPPRTRTRPQPSPDITLSALEAGQTTTENHLQTISAHLRKYAPIPPHARSDPNHQHSNSTSPPIIPLDAWSSLYTDNAHATGQHFVIHQHDHPIAGPHYDLRLQISASSSVSWAIMYGLPGDPNSRRLNRNATETRVHCLWNHLIETGSARTGSMIIWDTGVYEVLPSRGRGATREPETESDSDARSTLDSTIELAANAVGGRSYTLTESEKLREAFQNHKINLRLHGTRLPKNYTIFLRRDRTDFRSPATPSSIAGTPRKKRRVGTKKKRAEPSTSDSNTDSDNSLGRKRKRDQDGEEEVDEHEHAEHSDTDTAQAQSDYLIRLNNAYPGAVNDIGSVHQRRWFIGLDRVGCGFVVEKEKDDSGAVRRRWVREYDKRSGELGGFEPFYVRGPAVERSVVTGRLGADVLKDEGVDTFIPRKGWNPVIY